MVRIESLLVYVFVNIFAFLLQDRRKLTEYFVKLQCLKGFFKTLELTRHDVMFGEKQWKVSILTLLLVEKRMFLKISGLQSPRQ